MKFLINLFFLFVFLINLASAQGYDARTVYDTLGVKARAEIGKEAIRSLKGGVLIVRLKTGSSKLAAMEKVVQNPETPAKNKQRILERIAAEKKATREENEWLIEALNTEYSFNEYLLLPDTAVQYLKDGVQSGYFYNEQLEPDPAISLNQRSYLLTYYGATASATKSGVEGMVVVDNDFKELPDPFPHFTGLTTTRKSLSRFFNKTKEVDFFKLMINRFNQRLGSYYDLND